MNNNNTLNNRTYRKLSIKTNWIILAAIIFSVLATSCTQMKSIRSNSYYSKNSKKNTQSNNNNDDIAKHFANLKYPNIDSSSINNGLLASNLNNQIDTSFAKKLPTLREQMKSIQDEQIKTNERINTIQSDVKEIKNSIDDIKEAVNVLNGKQPRTPVRGSLDMDKTDDSIIEPEESDDNKNTILSNETIELNKSNPNKAKTLKNTKNTKTKPKSNTNQKVIIKPKQNKENTNSKPENHNVIPEENEEKELITDKNNIQLKDAINCIVTKNYNEAIDKLTFLSKSEKNSNNLSTYNYYLGEAFYGLKQYNKAITHYQKVLSIANSPKKDNALAKIAESQIRNGDISDAKKTYKSLMNKYPQSEYIPQARKMLQQL